MILLHDMGIDGLRGITTDVKAISDDYYYSVKVERPVNNFNIRKSVTDLFLLSLSNIQNNEGEW